MCDCEKWEWYFFSIDDKEKVWKNLFSVIAYVWHKLERVGEQENLCESDTVHACMWCDYVKETLYQAKIMWEYDRKDRDVQGRQQVHVRAL